MATVRHIPNLLLFLLLSGCSEAPHILSDPEEERPYGAKPIQSRVVSRLKDMFPADWNNPPRGNNPASNQMRLLARIIGKKRSIEQKVFFTNANTTHTTRTSTSFLDSSGQYIIGKDWNHDAERKETTRFILFHEKETNLFRGLSWTRNALGEQGPVQMVGRFIPGKPMIEWKGYHKSAGVDTISRLFLTSSENFVWEIERIREDKPVTLLTNISNLKESWP